MQIANKAETIASLVDPFVPTGVVLDANVTGAVRITWRYPCRVRNGDLSRRRGPFEEGFLKSNHEFY